MRELSMSDVRVGKLIKEIPGMLDTLSGNFPRYRVQMRWWLIKLAPEYFPRLFLSWRDSALLGAEIYTHYSLSLSGVTVGRESSSRWRLMEKRRSCELDVTRANPRIR